MRHNELREVCHEVRALTEVLNERTANTRPEARLNVSSVSFWKLFVFFDIRVFNLHVYLLFFY